MPSPGTIALYEQNFPRGMVTAEPNRPFASEGNSAGRISAELVDGILVIRAEDDPPGESLLALFGRGVKKGWITPDMPALVDLTRFTGSVDWAAVRAVREMAPWGDGAPGRSRVAYLIPDSEFNLLIRIAAALFTRTRHRAFLECAAAMEWLRR